MSNFILLIYWTFFFSASNPDMSRNCNPSVSVSSVSTASAPKLIVQKADTIQVRMSCLTMCKPLLESKDLKILPLEDDTFIVMGNRPGRVKITVFSDCPINTSVEMGGRLQNVSGRMELTSVYLEVSN